MWFARRPLGRRGEDRAASFLRRTGVRILARSYTCAVGEIDLVGDHAGTIVFVEVKTRSSTLHGEPWQAVDAAKMRRVTRAAVYFLSKHHLANRAVRFDVVAVSWPKSWWTRPTIEHFPNAFEAVGPWSV
ncbi:MAG: YraN family protein [Planctomycetia bacterium]